MPFQGYVTLLRKQRGKWKAVLEKRGGVDGEVAPLIREGNDGTGVHKTPALWTNTRNLVYVPYMVFLSSLCGPGTGFPRCMQWHRLEGGRLGWPDMTITLDATSVSHRLSVPLCWSVCHSAAMAVKSTMNTPVASSRTVPHQYESVETWGEP